MPSPERTSMEGYTEGGFNKELLDVAEQIEKGLKRGRIPVGEALTLLKKFIETHPKSPEDEKDECLILMEQIEDDVRRDWIPEKEAIELLRALNDKYPVE